MKVIYGLRQIKKYRKPVVALGVFDGVHLGHRRILTDTVKMAKQIKGTSIAITFWPHPQKEESLYSLEHRLRLIEGFGVDVCIVINFTQKFAKILAVDFIKDILFRKIRAHYVYVGKNFRFGKDAEGNFKTLDKLSKIGNFRLKVFKVVKINNRVISSTCIRTLIKQGNLVAAQKILSRPVSVLGTVIKGDSLGRRLGFPTANINPHHEVVPPRGVYAVSIIFNGKKFNGICYIGNKPTFKSQIANRKSQIAKYVEVYIFDFHKNIYGRDLEIRFIKKIREEREFDSCQALVGQVKKDTAVAKSLFSHHNSIPQYMPL